jgi:hypothetical protein
MATLETQYQNYLAENPTSTLTYDEWMDKAFPEPPYVSDDFQIGPDGAFEYDDDNIADWDVALMDGLEDENWAIESRDELKQHFKECLQSLLADKEAQEDEEIVDFYLETLCTLVNYYNPVGYTN